MATEIETTPRPETRSVPYPHVDASALEAELRDALEGEVRFRPGDRALYATDAGNYRRVPIGVVIPRTLEDVVRAVEIARAHDAPVLPRGGGTSLAGQCCNTAVVLDFSKYLDAVLEIDAADHRARVLPGTILDHLRDDAHEHGLTFGPDPATHRYCTIGGMLGNNSCGVRSVQAEFYGPGPRTGDNVESMEVLTYDGTRMRVGPTSEAELKRIIRAGGRKGEIYRRLRDLRDRYADLIRERSPDIPRRVSGYDLAALLPENGFNVARALVGTEGTCVTILEATLTLTRHFPGRALLVLGYPSVYDAADHVPEIREHRPIGIEGMDARLIEFMRKKGLNPAEVEMLPDGDGWLIVEFGGEDEAEAAGRARRMMDALNGPRGPEMRLFEDPADQEKIWEIRESGLGATAFVPGEPDAWPGWEDAAVPPDRVGDYLRDFRALLDRYGYDPALYGHFGQGCIHTRIDFDLRTADGVDQFRGFTHEAAELVVRYGGALSGEHGDGQARADLLPIMYGDELVDAFREFKRIWDPRGRMNPGKVVDPDPRDANLRIGPSYRPATPDTHFRYPNDEGGFPHATVRCVGVGKCRRTDGGTMCPSYMVLREEKHTTRGRAHLLFEMLEGDPVGDGWANEEVKESLDLCLSCKGCKGDCPVNVDIATYKAEFMSHYYERKRRPRSAYAFGLIDRWARLASVAPRLVNAVTQAPGLAAIAKAAAGVAPERTIPRFAPRTFTSWWRARAPRASAGRRVILWPDTFNNHFHPETLAAGAEVLENAGFRVVVPEGSLCCGRPLYEFGMLDRARSYLRRVLHALGDELGAGTPIIGLEPSCVAVFRDELIEMLPDDIAAQRLTGNAFTLGEFLAEHADDYEPPRLDASVLVHGHCHHEAVLDLSGEQRVLAEAGLDFEVLDSGCCGMAGPFGFEKDKYDVSIGAGERVLLPAVRAAGDEAIILADGFSCREQIEQTTDRRALHLAEVLRLADRCGGRLTAGDRPEDLADVFAEPELLGAGRARRARSTGPHSRGRAPKKPHATRAPVPRGRPIGGAALGAAVGVGIGAALVYAMRRKG